jgi:4-amino-4-deoxy-L-arabinose transferase-like glycosyltransferase
MSADLAALAGVAAGVAGVTLAHRWPRRGGVLLGVGVAAAFTGNGLVSALLIVLLAAAAPLVSPAARARPYANAMMIALGVAAVLGGLWPLLVARADPAFWSAWVAQATATRWSTSEPLHAIADATYFAKILPWYAWPALPLAAWTLWRARKNMLGRPNLLVPLLASVLFFVVLSLFADAREVNAMPLLIPLVLLGVAEVDSLPRGGASALDWFGVMTFALAALVVWAVFAAALTGSPAGVANWLAREIPGYTYPFRFIPVALAALLTCVWVVVVASSLRSPRRAVVNWTAGMTMVWMLTMMLGLPLIDQARSYRGLSSAVAEQAKGAACTLGAGLGAPQRALLDYFTGLRPKASTAPGAEACDTLLVQISRGRGPEVDAARWNEVWRGSRPGDDTEAFVLYRLAPAAK